MDEKLTGNNNSFIPKPIAPTGTFHPFLAIIVGGASLVVAYMLHRLVNSNRGLFHRPPVAPVAEDASQGRSYRVLRQNRTSNRRNQTLTMSTSGEGETYPQSEFESLLEPSSYLIPRQPSILRPYIDTGIITPLSMEATNFFAADTMSRDELSRMEYTEFVERYFRRREPIKLINLSVVKDTLKPTSIVADNWFTDRDYDLALRVYQLSRSPRDPVMERIIRMITKTHNSIERIDPSLPKREHLELRDQYWRKFKAYYDANIGKTKAKDGNLRAYFLAHYSNDSNYIKVRKNLVQTSFHHGYVVAKLGRIVYEVDYFGHCAMHLINTVETDSGNAQDLNVSQSLYQSALLEKAEKLIQAGNKKNIPRILQNVVLFDQQGTALRTFSEVKRKAFVKNMLKTTSFNFNYMDERDQLIQLQVNPQQYRTVGDLKRVLKNVPDQIASGKVPNARTLRKLLSNPSMEHKGWYVELIPDQIE